MAIAKLRKNDTVVITAGKDKGKTGVILSVDVERYKAKVKGINMVSKCLKRRSQEDTGGIVKQEAFIDMSNLALWDVVKNKKISVGIKTLDNGKRARFDKSSGDLVEEQRGNDND